jgi:Fe-S cluster biogenesis protein NfuA/nitrite reductase/ring-hydroxylating ferredoxin subunit
MAADSGNLRQISDRVEGLLQEVRSMAAPPAVERVEELLRLIVHLYGKGLERILSSVAESDTGEAQVFRLAQDPLVASLLVLHGLHPVPLRDRIQRALETVRPYLGSHAGGVELLEVDPAGVARLRLQGSCSGCPSSTLTVKLAIERAIEEAAPEITRVEVEGIVSVAPAGRPEASQNGNGRVPTSGGWASVDGLEKLAPGSITALEVEGARVMVCSVAGKLYAYRNACAECGSVLEKGSLLGEVLSCPSCDQRFDVRLAGRGVDRQNLHLDPFPLLEDSSGARIALPETHR